MPNIAKILKEEITRLAKKETKAATAKLRKDTAELKRRIAEHKRRIARLELDNRRLSVVAEAGRKESVKAKDDEIEKARITAKMIRSIRAKFKLSQDEFARLVGVTSVTVYQWEHKQGRLTFRGDSKAAIVEIRKLKSFEVKKRLGEMKGKAKGRGRRKRR